MKENGRKIGIAAAVILVLAALVYLGGVLGQLLSNYAAWQAAGGLGGQAVIQGVSFDPLICFRSAFTVDGLKGMAIFLGAVAAVFAYIKTYDRFGGKDADPAASPGARLGYTARRPG